MKEHLRSNCSVFARNVAQPGNPDWLRLGSAVLFFRVRGFTQAWWLKNNHVPSVSLSLSIPKNTMQNESPIVHLTGEIKRRIWYSRSQFVYMGAQPFSMLSSIYAENYQWELVQVTGCLFDQILDFPNKEALGGWLLSNKYGNCREEVLHTLLQEDSLAVPDMPMDNFQL